MIPIKTQKEIQKMRAACRVVADTHEKVKAFIKPGITTAELDRIAEDFILSVGAKPNFKNYCKYPAATCISVNDVVIHGIPGAYALQEGDLVSIDLGAVLDGWHGDAARTFAVGKVSSAAEKLLTVTRECFFEGIKQARSGRTIGDISHAVQTHAEKNGFSVVRTFCGHGIGRALHEEPQIPNYGVPGQGPRLQAGHVLAIEPMINLGGFAVTVDQTDGWTVRTRDGTLSAHYENTVLITQGEPEILTDTAEK